MGNTAREINQLVQEAARKKKEDEKHRRESEKTEFISTAVDGMKKLEQDLKKDKSDHSNAVTYFLSALGVLFFLFLVYQVIQLHKEKDMVSWKIQAVESDDLKKASSLIAEILSRPKMNVQELFKADAPEPWKRRLSATIADMRGLNFKVTDAVVDEKARGEKSIIKVSCLSGDSKQKVVFYVYFAENQMKIMMAEKNQL